MKQSSKQAYSRELALLPIVMQMENIGVPLHPDIENIAESWEQYYAEGESLIAMTIGHDVKIGGKHMFNRLRELDLINEDKIEYTAKGNARYGREFISKIIKDESLVKALTTRSKLTKIIGTYLRPWADSYKKHRRFHPFFNQVRNEDDKGTRTGRFSSNLQQIPKEPDPDLINLRTLIYPEDGDIILVRDFSAQEIRVAAHYAEGDILDAYNLDPDMDAHEFVRQMILDKTGLDIPRRVSKTVTFLKLYGGGAQAAADMLGLSVDIVKKFFKAYDQAMPSFKALAADITYMVKGGTMLRTWGGRQYDVEPASLNDDGRKWEKHYKLINVLIQGSSADMTKEAMLRYWSHPDMKGRLMLQVHDELVVSVKPEDSAVEMEVLKWAMDEIPGWDVPIRSSGDFGPSYGELVPWTN